MSAPPRRLAAILVADVVGFSKRMERDDAGTLAKVRAIRADIVDPAIAAGTGRIVKTTGDGLLAEFASADAALRCAVRVQRELAARNAGLPDDERIDVRIGINLGDVIVEDDDIFGDGVNVAARLESLAPAGGICVSAAVRDQVHGNLDAEFVDAGERRVKNIARPIRAYLVDFGDGRNMVPMPASSPKLRTMSLGMCPFVSASNDTALRRAANAATRDFAAMLARSSTLVSIVPMPPALAGKSTDEPGAVGRALSVRYLVEGDLRAASLHARVVDAASGEQVWSESASLPVAGDADSTARSLHALAWHLSRAVLAMEIRRVLAEPLPQSTPLEHVLRAIALDRTESDVRKRIAEKERLVEEALARDPSCVPAITILAITLSQRMDYDPSADPVALAWQMLALTAKAVRLNDAQPTTWFMHSVALVLTGQWQASLEACAKAIRLEPYSSMLLSHRGELIALGGRPEEALAMIEEAIAMDPQAGWPHMQIASTIHLLLGNYAHAAEAGEKAIGLGAEYSPERRLVLVAAHAHLDDMAKAVRELDEVIRAFPGYTIGLHRSRHRLAHPAWLALVEQHLYPGLRKAGLPES